MLGSGSTMPELRIYGLVFIRKRRPAVACSMRKRSMLLFVGDGSMASVKALVRRVI